jgi:hypothetical protein
VGGVYGNQPSIGRSVLHAGVIVFLFGPLAWFLYMCTDCGTEIPAGRRRSESALVAWTLGGGAVGFFVGEGCNPVRILACPVEPFQPRARRCRADLLGADGILSNPGVSAEN